MQGLELAGRFYLEWGVPYLHHRFPDVAGRMSAGVFRGSQVLEADDEWSRDHGWGPMFLLLLPEDDYARQGPTVEQALQADAPREWLGYRFLGPGHNVEVSSIDHYLTYWLGFAAPPTEWRAWLGGTPHSGAREHELYLVRHGQVFADPLGEVAARRQAWWQYPKLAWWERIWDELFSIWHFGQYNVCERLVHRDDPISLQVALAHFVEAVMRLALLLEHDYTPYWKWLVHAFQMRAAAVEVGELLGGLCQPGPVARQAQLVGEVCRHVHEWLEAAGLASADLSSHPHPLFCDQQALRVRIDHEAMQDES
jgi:hypothetical protein